MRQSDDIDEKIIDLLVEDGRISTAALARKVGLSPNAAGARVARLFSSGVLSGVHARVNHAALGRTLDVIIDCALGDATDSAPLRAVVADDERVIESVFVTGSIDHRLRAVVSSPEDLRDLLQRLVTEGEVRTSDTRLIIGRHPVGGRPGTTLDEV